MSFSGNEQKREDVEYDVRFSKQMIGSTFAAMWVVKVPRQKKALGCFGRWQQMEDTLDWYRDIDLKMTSAAEQRQSFKMSYRVTERQQSNLIFITATFLPSRPACDSTRQFRSHNVRRGKSRQNAQFHPVWIHTCGSFGGRVCLKRSPCMGKPNTLTYEDSRLSILSAPRMTEWFEQESWNSLLGHRENQPKPKERCQFLLEICQSMTTVYHMESLNDEKYPSKKNVFPS